MLLPLVKQAVVDIGWDTMAIVSSTSNPSLTMPHWVKLEMNVLHISTGTEWGNTYRISSYSFLPWIVSSPWILSSSSEETIQVFIT